MWCSLWISCWFAALWWRMWAWTQRQQFRTGPALSVACLSHFRSLEKVLPRKPKLIQSCDYVVGASSGRSAECSRPGCQQCCFLSECRLIPSSSELSVCVDAGGWSAAPGWLHRPQSCWPRTQTARGVHHLHGCRACGVHGTIWNLSCCVVIIWSNIIFHRQHIDHFKVKNIKESKIGHHKS